MIISYQWLCDYLPEPVPIDDLTHILTSIGLEVEAVEPVETIKGGLEGLVIGEVLTCEKHPNADKLKLTTVAVGNGHPLNIVCGAANVAAGQKVVVATVGTTVYPTHGEPFMIKNAKIRGEASEGMICAEDEIGLGENHEGILILPETAVIGTLANVYFNLPKPDSAIHIGLTPNRSDAMSHIGVARDVCAYLTHHHGKKYQVRMPVAAIPDVGKKQIDIKVSINAPEACPRYTGISLVNLKVGPSPEWLQQRLKTIEVRSVNNVVDITNYVLHEFGQPLHAFDADSLGGSEIRVGFLPAGTPFTTLDDKERKLAADDLMISDAAKPIAIAGVFGGLHSGINENTTSIFLESAYFNPANIRRTSLRYGLRTDAATHFEKSVDINNVLPALKRAASLMVELTGAIVASDIEDVYPRPLNVHSIQISYSYIQKLSGKHYNPGVVRDVLYALGFEIKTESDDYLVVTVPSNKTDVLQPADIVEEILRIDGLDNINIPERLSISLAKGLKNDRKERERIAGLLCGMGFQEIVTNSIVNSKFYPERNDLVKMLNSLSSELDVMRPSMLESGLEVIQYNYNRKSQDLLLFEFGKIYTRQGDKYIEEQQLALWITGNAQPANWNTKAIKADVFYLKGVINNLLLQSGIKFTSWEKEDVNGTSSIIWKNKNNVLCSVSNIPAKRLSEFDVKQEVCYACFNWDVLLDALYSVTVRYAEVTKYPSVTRDLAMIIDKNIDYHQVKEVTDHLKLDALQSFGLFDIFESEKIGTDKKSYALSYTFQLQDRTLTDNEIEQLMQQLVKAYKNKLQAQIRE